MIWRFKLLLIVAGLLVAGVSLAQKPTGQPAKTEPAKLPLEKSTKSPSTSTNPRAVAMKVLEDLRTKSINQDITPEEARRAILVSFDAIGGDFKSQSKQLEKESISVIDPAFNPNGTWEYSFGRWNLTLKEKRLSGALSYGKTTRFYKGVFYYEDNTWKVELSPPGLS